MNKDLLIRRNMRQAEKELGKGHIDSAMRLCDAVIRLDQNHREASLLRLKCLITTKNPRELLVDAESIIRKFPDAPEAWMDSGFIYYQNHEYAEAISSYRRCISLNPGNYRAVHNLGGALIANGEEEEGLSLMEDAIRMEPGYLAGYSRLMKVYHEKGRYSDCIRCGESAGDPMKSPPEIRGYYGDALYRVGRYADSRVILSSLLADMQKRTPLFTLFCPVVTDADNYHHQGRGGGGDPDFAAATYYLAFMDRFIVSGSQSPAISTPLLLRVLEVNPEHVYALAALSRVKKMEGKRDEAFGYIEEASGYEPENDDILLMKAFYHVDSDPAGSLTLFDDILVRRQEDLLAEYGRVFALQGLGRKNEAELIVRRLRKRSPAFFSEMSRLLNPRPGSRNPFGL